MDQIQLHKKIDLILSKIPEGNLKDETIGYLLSNADARQYFFTQANESWLDWLWKNGFLDAIKKPSDDPTKYSYRTPELSYLARVANQEPKIVVDIMLSIKISKEDFNPETLDQFLRISSELPHDQLARLVSKMLNEEWVQLMGRFNNWGFEFEKMFKTLSEAKDYENLLALAQAVLSIKDKKTFQEGARGYFKDNPFYFQDLSYSKVFSFLSQVPRQFQEKALKVVCDTLSKIIQLADEAGADGYFQYKDLFYLYSADLFELELREQTSNSDRENVKALVAVIKKFINELLTDQCNDFGFAKKIFTEYIASLPLASSTWRLRLYTLSLCPQAFRDELKEHFSVLFDSLDSGHSYYEIEGGTEYHKTLKKTFDALEEEYKRNYVSNIFKNFGAERSEKDEERLYRRTGWEILSSICSSLTEEEKRRCKEVFGKECNEDYQPEPLIGEIKGGVVMSKGVVSQEEFGRYEINEIVEKLKKEWKPSNLKEENTHEDFLNPTNAEGIGSQLRKDIPQRLQAYVDNAKLFFDREKLDQHYTQSFYRGLQEAIRIDKEKAHKIKWSELIQALLLIVESGSREEFDSQKRERESFGGWLSNWEGVHSSIADVVQELLSESEGRTIIDFPEHREQILTILEYLLHHSDPEPKDEELETAVSKTRISGEQEEYLASDPFSIAINSVRGRAFEAFTLFLYQDGKKYKKTDAVKITEDVKMIYEKVLNKEDTRALMFMYGHYLPSFYFRDKKWVSGLLNAIFPEEENKKHLYVAAWEGYLSNNLYEEIFFEPAFQKLYERGLELTGKEDAGRRYFKEPDEGLAVHLALAFVVYHQKFGFEDRLFKAFWVQDEERQAKFIGFIGRLFISGDNQGANELLAGENKAKERIMDFWDWVLNNKQDKKLFVAFGYWINCKKSIFEPAWLAERILKTLTKTNGDLEWEHGLDTSIVKLAENAPIQTLEIIQLYLLEGGVRNKQIRMPFLRDDEWFEAIEILYKNPATKEDTYKLINDLITEGGSMFWKLKEVVE